MIFEVTDQKNLKEIKILFNDIRFYMGNSVLDGVMGKVFVDNVRNPNIAFLVVRNYCFISGNIDDKDLKIDSVIAKGKIVVENGKAITDNIFY